MRLMPILCFILFSKLSSDEMITKSVNCLNGAFSICKTVSNNAVLLHQQSEESQGELIRDDLGAKRESSQTALC